MNTIRLIAKTLALTLMSAPATFFGPEALKAKAGSEFKQCSFNYQIIPCKIASSGRKYFTITWIDGKKQTYYGERMNNTYLTDKLGGSWRYLDFDTGRSFSLKNPANGNVIIWNGTYKDYGSYVGL